NNASRHWKLKRKTYKRTIRAHKSPDSRNAHVSFQLHCRNGAICAPDLMPHVVSAFCQIWSRPTTCFSTFQSFAVGSRLAHRSATQEGSAKVFKEELIKSLPELADVYEKWATEDEARADEILARRILTPTKCENINLSVRAN